MSTTELAGKLSKSLWVHTINFSRSNFSTEIFPGPWLGSISSSQPTYGGSAQTTRNWRQQSRELDHLRKEDSRPLRLILPSACPSPCIVPAPIRPPPSFSSYTILIVYNSTTTHYARLQRLSDGGLLCCHNWQWWFCNWAQLRPLQLGGLLVRRLRQRGCRVSVCSVVYVVRILPISRVCNITAIWD
jgi:hypothetical protein